MYRRLTHFVRRECLKRDLLLSRPPGQFYLTEYKLRAAKRRGLQVTCAVDGGAAHGHWAQMIKGIYPDCDLLCVEPRSDVRDDLRALAREFSNVHVVTALLGPREADVDFNEMEDQSSVLMDHAGRPYGHASRAHMTTLDALVEREGLPPPDLIKLDLQGYELEAMKGAKRSLASAQALLLEVSFLRLQAGTPIAHEVIGFAHEHGFVIYDIPELWHRPLDGALAQGDVLFLREDHPLLQDKRYRASD